MSLTDLQKQVSDALGDKIASSVIALDELTIEVPAEHIHEVSLILRDDTHLAFDTLIDICGVDYLDYGYSEWATASANAEGYSRGVIRGVPREEQKRKIKWEKPRFAVVYHLLSVKLNHRLRVRVFPNGEPPVVDSVVDVWNCANWFEREAFDLYGILFKNHPDLRRILTDYDFNGHPFRKDFPLIGEVEMRYDATQKRCIYEPVSIQQRTLVPKVIREDSRYLKEGEGDVGNS